MAPTIEELIHVESGLSRAFAGYLFAVLSAVAWPMVASGFGPLVPIPLVSTVIAVSPLSIKFLLGGQLQTAIREQTSMAMHASA
jgi:hypothetical protein